MTFRKDFITDLFIQFKSWLLNIGVSDTLANILHFVLVLIVVLIISWVADVLFRYLLQKVIPFLIRKSKTRWDDILLKHKVFNAFAHLAPAIVFSYLGHWFNSEIIIKIIQKFVFIYAIIIFLTFTNLFLNAVNEIYEFKAKAREKNLKIYIQIFKVFLFSMGILLIVSILFNITLEGIWKIILSLGAFATILLIVYKDTILGLVAGITLSANKMVRIGDWISMPKQNADGVVSEITLTSVKVQNWDKTISNIPTYSLISESFINWRGMEESGGRRIKRHINIDINSIHFLSEEEIKEFSQIELIKDYINTIKKEIDEDNKGKDIPINQRRLTNVGTFRKYIECHLKNNPKISDSLTFLVRQLQPTSEGLPLEIYVFSKDQVWANYEGIQADIFDHVLSVAKDFNLNIFQNPSGKDFRTLKKLEE